ncbi:MULTISPECIES: AraC family transcriptional regulator [unclassified Arcicella]|uniref:AraC family transcriptional regulator n=1 Tax=unclassified Arcicella TaxID=2644986 RepID=UPI0028575FC7|nr:MULTISPECIES: AraC family transcriptional regulator [unclassified Arcicella]MDR6560496.1 AraC-like DNA-binding protein/quercetin dioxygenase-like cupin family protein [Arcicella sp. BE51]MDR6809898.1 AraC-like DNA-binding protein/quercetin dioxygenase-like cupin family protein [Arcicella sp. BE140]MDR6821247.1 AraC-like DNA-binding protein/quercetin dioxygenase-like cupin family protein [Arcicella sp. BE139]
MKQLDIPVYSIDRFNSKSEKTIQFQIEPFDINRNFKVTYPHRHDDFYEILFLTQGQGIHTIDFQNYTIKPNTIFFLSPGQIHELDLSEDVKGYIFLFTSSFYHFNKTDPYKLFELPFFYNLNQETPPIYLENQAEKQVLTELFKNAIYENQQNLTDSEEAIRALLDLILIQCKRIYPLSNYDDKTSKGKIMVKRFKQLIEEKCQENLSVKDYAHLLAITPNYLSETVKSVTGRTSTDLINDRMIMEIKRFLTHTDLGISEIAYQLNFSDQSYFSKYFKKLTNLSPLEFRNGLSR